MSFLGDLVGGNERGEVEEEWAYLRNGEGGVFWEEDLTWEGDGGIMGRMSGYLRDREMGPMRKFQGVWGCVLGGSA